jgi:hypothetical protein
VGDSVVGDELGTGEGVGEMVERCSHRLGRSIGEIAQVDLVVGLEHWHSRDDFDFQFGGRRCGRSLGPLDGRSARSCRCTSCCPALVWPVSSLARMVPVTNSMLTGWPTSAAS